MPYAIHELGPYASAAEILNATNAIIGREPKHHGTKKRQIGVNIVGGEEVQFRSDTNCYLNWHSEGYDVNSDNIEFLCLYCIKSATHGGETLTCEFTEILDNGILSNAKIRVRKNGTSWSNWISVYDGVRLRFTLPDTGKDVQYKDIDFSVQELQELIDRNKTPHLLNPGQLLIIDNNKTLHARNSYLGERQLLRMVY